MDEVPLARNGDNTLNSQKIPIVVVPGVMGSRLRFQNAVFPIFRWDPDNKLIMANWLIISADDEREFIRHDRNAFVLQGDSLLTLDFVLGLTKDQIKHGWGTVVNKFYRSLLSFLSQQKFGNCDTPVHAVGYDWRQSNKDSGTFLANRIAQILKDEGTNKVIIVTHSMGGLVTRSALLNNSTLSNQLVGVLHIQQPVNGAVVFYRRFYTGNISPQDDDPVVNFLLGNTADKWATIVCQLRGPVELIPTPNYKDGADERWIHFFTGQPPTRVAVGGPGVDWTPYLQKDHPPGLGGPITFTVNVQAELAKRANEAKAFHDMLGLRPFKHDLTWTVFTDKLETDVAFSLDQNGNVEFSGFRRNEGDGTVPASSASALFPGAAHRAVAICDGDPRQFVIDNVGHADGPNNPSVQDLAGKIIRKMLGILCFPPVPPRPKPSGEVAEEDVGYHYDDVEQRSDPVNA